MDRKGIRASFSGVSSGVANPQTINIERYKRTRYWAVWLNGQLLAVTVYKKGAMAIKEKLLCTVDRSRGPNVNGVERLE